MWLQRCIIVVKGRISVRGTNNSNRKKEKMPFENNVTRQKYKKKITGSTPTGKKRLGTEVVTTLKYLSNFWSFFICIWLTMINYNIWNIWNFWVAANPAGNPPTDSVLPILTSDAIFQINSTKLYIPVVTLSIHYNMQFLKNMNHGFKNKSKKQD